MDKEAMGRYRFTLKQTMMAYLSRITNLKGFDNVLLGRDLAKQLKPGMVYGVRNIAGSIILVELGPHAALRYPGSTISEIAVDGVYCLTEDEYAVQLKAEET